MHKGIRGFFRFVGSVALVFFLGACATGGSPHGGPSGTGVVMSIAESEVGSRAGSIVGAIGGANVGPVVGGQNGRRLGRPGAPTAGASATPGGGSPPPPASGGATCTNAPMAMMDEMALVTLISGVCSDGVTFQTTM